MSPTLRLLLVAGVLSTIVPGAVGAGEDPAGLRAPEAVPWRKGGSREAALGSPAREDRVLLIDFGPAKRQAPESLAFDRDRRFPGLGWVGGVVLAEDRRTERDPLLGDFFRGFDAEFRLPVRTDAEYRGVLTLGDPEGPQGPCRVLVNGEPVVEAPETAAGEFVDVHFSFRSEEGRLALRLIAPGCRTFCASGLAVYEEAATKRGIRPWQLSQQPSGDPPPFRPAAPDTGASGTPFEREATRAALREVCEYLLAAKPSDECFALSGSWYESSFAVRTLLAGAAILAEDRYREAALACVDRFVEEQLSDGNWAASTFGRRGCANATDRATPASANLADVGCMALCLPVAAAQAGEEDGARYLSAARRYADTIVLPNQLESGAFPNLLFEGEVHRTAYSVATGVQASFLSALSEATGVEAYLRAAERAALFLVLALEADGSTEFHAHDRAGASGINSGNLGDLFYTTEGLLWTRRYAREDMRMILDDSLVLYLDGPAGLRRWIGNPSWWGELAPWEGSKRAGVLYLLSLTRAGWPAARDLEPALAACRARLGLGGGERPFGILADPLSLEGAFASAASGFYGLGLAAELDPGALFPRRPPGGDR